MQDVSAGMGSQRLRKPMVLTLFFASCLLSVVSWYTTQLGMAHYLSPWMSLFASVGVQTALVAVAWLAGMSRRRRGLLVAVYAVTALISMAFSYVSLYGWFASREEPALVQRRLYDDLAIAAGKGAELLTAAIGEGQRHAVALEEMGAAERSRGFVSRGDDSDRYLAQIREAVAREARSYSEGAGEGIRYSAFGRHAKMTRESVAQLQSAKVSLDAFLAESRVSKGSEEQMRAFRKAHDAIPWVEVEKQLHRGELERPQTPRYADHVDQSGSRQEELMTAIRGLVTDPTQSHLVALALAAFIDVLVFLLAFGAGPHFCNSPEERWIAMGAAVDGVDHQVFVRNLLRKVDSDSRGLPRIDVSLLSPGERQFCLVLASNKLAVYGAEDRRYFFLLDPAVHEAFVESLAEPGLAFQASRGMATPG